MKIEALNCPNCGAAVNDDSNSCGHCRSRLKTMSCPACFETIFSGNRYCPLCGASATSPEKSLDRLGNCPRCRIRLQGLEVAGISIGECERCDGIWTDADTFEAICADKEKQSAIISSFTRKDGPSSREKIEYVPCPECGVLMNRSNFARVSGVIIDRCKPHGIWFDASELPGIIAFIRQGGLDYAREKEKARLEDERSRLRQEQFTLAVDRFKSEGRQGVTKSTSARSVRELIDLLFG